MKKLELSPVDLQGHLEMYEKHRQKFGDFTRDALRLSRLEAETGKTYRSLMSHYERTVRRVRALSEDKEQLETRVRDLGEECEIKAKKLESLNRKSKKTQKVLDTLDKTMEELATYGLRPNDFETVKDFLNEIRRLGGDPAKAVKILKETSSLEAKRQEKNDQLNQLKQQNEAEKRVHRVKIVELEREEERLAIEIDNMKESLRRQINHRNETLDKLGIEESKQRKRIEGLKKRRVALEQQVDGLLKKQAALLDVQPDIDLVAEALPARKRELQQVKQETKEKRNLIVVAEAIAALLAKKPYNRQKVIRWLQFTRHDTTYGALDEFARQTIVEIMAKQGFVPAEKLEEVKEKAKKENSATKEIAKSWERIAKKRLEELKTCQEKLRSQRVAEDKELDKSINRKIVSIAGEIQKRV